MPSVAILCMWPFAIRLNLHSGPLIALMKLLMTVCRGGQGPRRRNDEPNLPLPTPPKFLRTDFPRLPRQYCEPGWWAVHRRRRPRTAHPIETGDYQEATDWVEEEPGQFPLLEARVSGTGRFDDAITTLRKPERLREQTPIACCSGQLEVEAGKYAGESLLNKALVIDDQHVESLARLGLYRIDQGKRESGQELLRKVIQIYKDMSREEAQKSPPETFVWFGKACEGLQRFRDAYEVMYDSALYLDPKSAAAHTASGHALFSKYNYPDARSHFRDALETNANHAEAMLGLARATWTDYAFPGERGEEVSQLLSKASRIWPDHPERWLLEGDIAFASENWNRAEMCCRKVLEFSPITDRPGIAGEHPLRCRTTRRV